MHDTSAIAPRARIIIDNDFGGDPDGLFQLAHHLLSPAVEIRGIIGSQHYAGGFYGSPGTSAFACEKVRELMNLMGKSIPVFAGSEVGLPGLSTPAESEAARLIVQEAMREDAPKPLYVVCGAGLTSIASALLLEPRIATRLTLVWIGGAEYEGPVPPGANALEYNLGIDIAAARVIFNQSMIPFWQVPRDAFRQALVTHAELQVRLKGKGQLGDYLFREINDLFHKSKRSLGEAYVLGDNPLVLLTALHSSWEADPSSSRYVSRPAPRITEKGHYEPNPDGRLIRVYTHLDVRILFEDLYAKIALHDTR